MRAAGAEPVVDAIVAANAILLVVDHARDEGVIERRQGPAAILGVQEVAPAAANEALDGRPRVLLPLAAEVVALAASCLGAAPPPLQALFWQRFPQLDLPAPLFNMICTNVPGPATPLYLAGRRLIAAYPQVPTGHELGINCAVQSYDGKLFFGLIADSDVAPDVRVMRDLVQAASERLCRAAGLRRQTRSTRRSHKAQSPPIVAPAALSVGAAG